MDTDTSFIEDLPRGPLDAYRSRATFNWKKLKLVFEDAELLKLKMKVWHTLERDPVFARTGTPMTTEEMKHRTAVQLHHFCHYKFSSYNIQQLPYKKKTRYLMTVNEALAVVFPEVSIKHAIGVSLFKNSLSTLGSERHKALLEAVWEGKVVACLALTEVAHGSNTKQMRTTATYDPDTKEFIINTPDFEAAKCWVGNLGKTCTYALLFAQLYTQGQCHGLHSFIVPIRDPKTLQPYAGLIVGDIGEKIALNGIDNGFIIFNNYRIPRENLLNRLAEVTPEGEYESSFTDPARMLGAALENLSTGRVGIMQESANNLINAVTIAIRYAALRKQFSDEDNVEVPIIEYQLHQWRLFRYVSAASVLKIFVASFTDDYLSAVEKSTTNGKLEDLSDLVSEVHAQVACAKPLITWTCRDACQECREACGGHGFLQAARLGEIRDVNDPTVTYEGDNNVLIQQTSNWLLRQWNLLKSKNKLSSPLNSCDFLQYHRQTLSKKCSVRTVKDVLSRQFVCEAYEWLITYLIDQTSKDQENLISRGYTKFKSRNECQVYRAAVLARAYAEYNSIRHFLKRIDKVDLSLQPVLQKLGLMYGISSLDNHLIYLYQGEYAYGSQLSLCVKQAILDLCRSLLPDVLGVIDALAPPDYVVNSVLGKTDGRLYENLQKEFFHNKGALSRPEWWQEIVVSDFPDLKLKNKL